MVLERKPRPVSKDAEGYSSRCRIATTAKTIVPEKAKPDGRKPISNGAQGEARGSARQLARIPDR
jgi:hypothetical protein